MINIGSEIITLPEAVARGLTLQGCVVLKIKHDIAQGNPPSEEQMLAMGFRKAAWAHLLQVANVSTVRAERPRENIVKITKRKITPAMRAAKQMLFETRIRLENSIKALAGK